MKRFYIRTYIRDKDIKEEFKKKKIGLFKSKIVKQKHYFVITRIGKQSTNNLVDFKIEVDRNIYDQCRINDEVGVCIKAEYFCSCFYGIDLAEKEPIIMEGEYEKT